MESKTGEYYSYQMAQVDHGDERRKNSKTGEDGSYHTAQVGTGDRGRKKSKNVFDLIWIEIGFKKKNFSRNELARSLAL